MSPVSSRSPKTDPQKKNYFYLFSGSWTNIRLKRVTDSQILLYRRKKVSAVASTYTVVDKTKRSIPICRRIKITQNKNDRSDARTLYTTNTINFDLSRGTYYSSEVLILSSVNSSFKTHDPHVVEFYRAAAREWVAGPGETAFIPQHYCRENRRSRKRFGVFFAIFISDTSKQDISYNVKSVALRLILSNAVQNGWCQPKILNEKITIIRTKYKIPCQFCPMKLFDCRCTK